MVTLPQPGDPVEDSPPKPSRAGVFIRWGLLPFLLLVFGGGLLLDRFL